MTTVKKRKLRHSSVRVDGGSIEGSGGSPPGEADRCTCREMQPSFFSLHRLMRTVIDNSRRREPGGRPSRRG